MAKVKGKAKLNKAISAQLEPFGIKKAQLTDEYAYYFDEEKVTFKITENEAGDEWFKEFVAERFGFDVKYPFVFSLLHEVGHHKTEDDVDGSLYDFCIEEKERIHNEMQTADDERSKALEWQYFNLPDEIIATAWAVRYCRKHPRKVKKMWAEMLIALQAFYITNGLLEEEQGLW